jgi:hypothetical protein
MAPTRSAVPPVSDEELLLVAEVARREGWEDLARPPAAHAAPRSLQEAAAVARFAALAADRAPRSRAGPDGRARLALALAAAAVVGACWWVSPARTAIALLGAGLICLIALRRRRRAGPPARAWR